MLLMVNSTAYRYHTRQKPKPPEIK